MTILPALFLTRIRIFGTAATRCPVLSEEDLQAAQLD